MMRQLFNSALAAFVVVCSAFAQSASADSQGRPIKFDSAAVERGRSLFASSCGFCHGTNAKGGDKGPDLLRSVLVLDDENGKTIAPMILKARPDKGMPRFPFTQAQISDIAAFLHSSIVAAADRDSYKILNIVVGDPKAGRSYFEAHCAQCHSATGDLKGIATHAASASLNSQGDGTPAKADERRFDSFTRVTWLLQPRMVKVLECVEDKARHSCPCSDTPFNCRVHCGRSEYMLRVP